MEEEKTSQSAKAARKEQFDSVRARLYDRGSVPRKNERTVLTSDIKTADVPHAWGNEISDTPEPSPIIIATPMVNKKRNKYRLIALLFGVFFFIAAVSLSSIYLLLGGNTISNENIGVAISGPSSIGGGEVATLQIGVSNQNNVALNSAVLNITFPPGTLSADAENKPLLRESIALDSIVPGETLNVPIKAQLYGEEDEEKVIMAEIQYRLQGSNGTFEAAAEPYTIKINSSPVTIATEGATQLSSGQAVSIDFVVRSNSSTVLRDLIVRAEYPFGFDFESASQNPISGQNVWKIDTLQPEETKKITVKGLVTGVATDERIVNVAVGVSKNTNTYALDSIFSASDFSYEIEESFINYTVAINNSTADSVVVQQGGEVQVKIEFTNPLESTLYDNELRVQLSGTALNESGVNAQRGFYDSIQNAVLFDHTTIPDLESVQPGETVRLQFTIEPEAYVRTAPELGMVFSAKARRVREARVAEALEGNISRTVRFASAANIAGSISHQSGFNPPVAEKMTQYTVTLRAESGSNDLIDTEVTANIPSYVSWLNAGGGDGEISFNPSARTLLWEVGDIADNSVATVTFTIGLLPSISQVGETPTLISSQSLKATDRFTGTVVRDTNVALTTQLIQNSNNRNEGVVQRTEE